MVKAFISYSHKDKDFLDTEILPVLRAIGVSAWTDKDILPGDFWIDAVEKQIQAGDWLVILLSESYQESITNGAGACRAELNWIVNHITTRRNPGRMITLWRAGEIPTTLQTYQAIDIRGNTARLVEDLRRLIAISSEKPPPAVVADPTPVSYPLDDDPSIVPELARHNFDVNVDRYHASLVAGNAMQARNAVTLLGLLERYYKKGLTPKADSWLDAGCGTGLVPYVADVRRNEHGCGWLIESKVRGGFDYAPRMVSFVNRSSQKYYTHVFEGDLRTLAREELENKTGIKAVELILANNVIHWLFRQDMIAKAVEHCRDLIRTGGLLAASIAAVGTGANFLTAYKAEMDEALAKPERDKWRNHIDNPIGLQSLDDVVRVLSRKGFKVENARLMYEPIEYRTTDDYVRDAKNYGEMVFMAPLLRKEPAYREEIWGRISRRFRELHFAEKEREPYVHDQFMIYLIARRFGIAGK